MTTAGPQGTGARRRPGALSYGHPWGVVMLDFDSQFIPGDMGNTSTFDFPVLFDVVPGLTVAGILADDEAAFTVRVVEAARRLVAAGASAITSNCGFMIRYQEDVARALDGVSVAMSSLLQLPMIASTLSTTAAVGIVTADSRVLTPELIETYLPGFGERVRIVGLESAPSFCHTMLNGGETLDVDAIGIEVVAASRNLAAHPEVGAILFECAALPPYAAATQQDTGLRVYDFTTMVDWLHLAGRRRNFEGYY